MSVIIFIFVVIAFIYSIFTKKRERKCNFPPPPVYPGAVPVFGHLVHLIAQKKSEYIHTWPVLVLLKDDCMNLFVGPAVIPNMVRELFTSSLYYTIIIIPIIIYLLNISHSFLFIG